MTTASWLNEHGERSCVQTTGSSVVGCGACCIAPSISSGIPGMPDGKPAGVRCIQLDDNNLCKIFGQSGRPEVCSAFKVDAGLCGYDDHTALNNLIELEQLT